MTNGEWLEQQFDKICDWFKTRLSIFVIGIIVLDIIFLTLSFISHWCFALIFMICGFLTCPIIQSWYEKWEDQEHKPRTKNINEEG